MDRKIFRFLFDRYLGSWLAPGFEADVELTEDLSARIAVIPAITAAAANRPDSRLAQAYYTTGHDDNRRIGPATARNLESIRDLVVRCACHAHLPEVAACWTLAPAAFRCRSGNPRVVSFALDVDQYANGDASAADDLYRCLPFLCATSLANCGNLVGAAIPRFKNISAYRNAADRLMVFPSHMDEDTAGSPLVHGPSCRRDELGIRGQMYHDGLGYRYSEKGIYGYERSLTTARCVWCWTGEPHFLNPEIFAVDTLGVAYDVHTLLVRSCWWLHAAYTFQMGAPPVVHLTAWDTRFGDFGLVPRRPTMWTIVLVSDAASFTALHGVQYVMPLMVPQIGGGRSVGNMRIYVANALPVGVKVVITDARAKTSAIIDHGQECSYPFECSPTHLVTACMDMAVVTSGAMMLGQIFPPSRFATFADVWGLEEVVVERSCRPAYRMDIQMSAYDLEWTVLTPLSRVRPIAFLGVGGTRVLIATGVGRSHTIFALRTVLAWSRGERDRVNWSVAMSLPLGVRGPMVRTTLHDSVRGASEAMPAPLTISQAVANEVGPVTWFVFGSAGDVTPVLALASVLAAWGVDIRVVRTHTEAQGLDILRAVESGAVITAAPRFLSTMVSVLSTGGFVIAPPEFGDVTVGADLRPPPHIIRPADFGIGWAFNFVLDSFLRTSAPIMRIGSYTGPFWVPRSADGLTFLRRCKRGLPRPVDIMLAWGSSTCPRPNIPGAVEVQPGDHFSQFCTAKVVVCHGGAGTVQTAAAAGARVVTATTILDRNYRDPRNAGRGTDFSGDPDNVMLALLATCPKVLVWAYRHSWGMFFRAVYWWCSARAYPAMWLVVVLFGTGVASPHMTIVIGQSLAASVLASLLTYFLRPSWAMLVGNIGESAVQYVVAFFGWSWRYILLDAVTLMARMAASQIVWLALFFGWGWKSLLFYYVVRTIRAPTLVFLELLQVVLADSGSLDEETALLCVSLAFPTIPVPLYHVRFCNRARTRRFEGNWGGAQTGNFAAYTVRVSNWVDSCPGEWCFETRIPWARFEAIPSMTAPYSPVWNCQSSALTATRGMWGMLGIAGFVLVPTVLWALLVAGAATLAAMLMVAALDVVPVLFVMLEALGLRHYVSPTRAVAYTVLRRSSDLNGDWYGTVSALVTGIATGWGADDPAVARGMDQVVRVWRMTPTQLVEAQMGQGVTDTLAARMLKMRLEMEAEGVAEWEDVA